MHGARARGKEELTGTYRLLINGRYEPEDIIEHSPYVFNLIKEGDYVNGYKVMGFAEEYYDADFDEYIKGFCYVLGNEEGMYRIPSHKIESIVTKEQFEAIKYIVKE